jgi:transcriptional regulator with XRE-family HTH domain
MTIEDLAERSGVDRSTIWALRTGRRWPDLLTVSRLEWNLRARIWPLEELLFADARTVDSAQDSRRANRRQSLKGA